MRLITSRCGSILTSITLPRICAYRSDSSGSTRRSVASIWRCRFSGQERRVLLLTTNSSPSNSNQMGLSWIESSRRLVPITVRMGSAASRRTSALSAVFASGISLERAHHAQRFDLDLDAIGSRTLVILAEITVREMVDVVATLVLLPSDHPSHDLRPAPHVPWINQEQRDARIAPQVLKPAAIRPAIDPEEAIFKLEPNRYLLDTAVLARGADDDGEHLSHKGLCLWSQLSCHNRNYPGMTSIDGAASSAFHRRTMGRERLGGSHDVGDRDHPLNAFPVDLLYLDRPAEAQHAERTEAARGSSGGKHMVRTRRIVTGGSRRGGPQEDGARIVDSRQ